jgi:hypothetical protein
MPAGVPAAVSGEEEAVLDLLILVDKKCCGVENVVLEESNVLDRSALSVK